MPDDGRTGRKHVIPQGGEILPGHFQPVAAAACVHILFQLFWPGVHRGVMAVRHGKIMKGRNKIIIILRGAAGQHIPFHTQINGHPACVFLFQAANLGLVIILPGEVDAIAGVEGLRRVGGKAQRQETQVKRPLRHLGGGRFAVAVGGVHVGAG